MTGLPPGQTSENPLTEPPSGNAPVGVAAAALDLKRTYQRGKAPKLD